jgi:hypothetical protein
MEQESMVLNIYTVSDFIFWKQAGLKCEPEFGQFAILYRMLTYAFMARVY